jgi:hypothetical protein
MFIPVVSGYTADMMTVTIGLGAGTNGVSVIGVNMKCASVGANAMSIRTDGVTRTKYLSHSGLVVS